MGYFGTTVDKLTRKVMFGAQKQGDRILEAICAFVDDCMTDHRFVTLPLTETPDDDDFMDNKILNMEGTLKEIVQMAAAGEPLSLEDRTYAKLLLGLQEFQNIAPNCSVNHECISDTGKCIFYVVKGTSNVSYIPPTGNAADVVAHARATSSKEEEAVALIERILKDCPNRGDYPEDDALAAIMYGEVYWKKEGN